MVDYDAIFWYRFDTMFHFSLDLPVFCYFSLWGKGSVTIGRLGLWPVVMVWYPQFQGIRRILRPDFDLIGPDW